MDAKKSAPRRGHARKRNRKPKENPSATSGRRRFVLVLHGNHQTGQLLLGRLDRLRKRLYNEFKLELIAPDAPWPVENGNESLRTWWYRENEDKAASESENMNKDAFSIEEKCRYSGIEESLNVIRNLELPASKPDKNGEAEDSVIVGILGFSQGARFAHLLVHQQWASSNHGGAASPFFPDLKFSIFVSGYDAPMPTIFSISGGADHVFKIELASLHVWGLSDKAVLPSQSESLFELYDPSFSKTFIHEGSHFVPVKAPQLDVYISFVKEALEAQSSEGDEKGEDVRKSTVDDLQSKNYSQLNTSTSSSMKHPEFDGKSKMMPSTLPNTPPDEDNFSQQHEEIQALEAIFPDEFKLVSSKSSTASDDPFADVHLSDYKHPMVCSIVLLPPEEHDPLDRSCNWPPHVLTVQVTYPPNYPSEASPLFDILHENNIYEFSSFQLQSLMTSLHETATSELGMPCVMSCVYAARDFLDEPRTEIIPETPAVEIAEEIPNESPEEKSTRGMLAPSSEEEIIKCNMEGLQIAQQILTSANTRLSDAQNNPALAPKGGSFDTYTCGLVGKPSAGKSTFFNAATAFSRQQKGASNAGKDDGKKDDDAVLMGGASMAPHPFTTIDANLGYCLVPAPYGLCPEDDLNDSERKAFGSTHGRDAFGRRFLPVLLKDVAGLVPGAYQGKGRGNQFLNDLCDANVLIHVLDASGTADAQGNKTVVEGEARKEDLTNPIDDMAWIKNELVEWITSNVTAKWDSIERKGRIKLAGMFSGYGQSQSMIYEIFSALEKFLLVEYQRDRALDHISTWTQGDVNRLVSAFLGVRFPMALALNKSDLKSSFENISKIQESLPVHGAHVATAMTARSEMSYVRNILTGKVATLGGALPPGSVWGCLTSAMNLRPPVLVFPVSDMNTYAPMKGMDKPAIGSASLPNFGMVSCMESAGGSAPSCWSPEQRAYVSTGKEKPKLRDYLMMKPGSTVEDCFSVLKRHGALSGEFVRAEGAGAIGEKPKPVPKHDVVGRHNCILKIMSNKRSSWQ